MGHRHHFFCFMVLLLLGLPMATYSQGLYTARGYWEETTKSNYLAIQKKLANRDSLTTNEKFYIQDYEAFLASYFQRLTQEEKEKYDNLKPQWDRELGLTPVSPVENKDFEWKGRDRLANGLYGFWYGISFVSIAGINNTAQVGIPLITSGLWMLGPALNPKKYEGISRNTVRACNTGKLLGLGYGYALGLAVSGNADSQTTGNWALGLSTLGSITLGEVGFQLQKKTNLPAGRIEMIRHYGFLGPWIGLSGVISAGSAKEPSLTGAVLVAGGVAGILIGNQVGKKYDYTRGDVDAIQSLTLIMTGLGFTAVTESLNNNSDLKSLILIPAASSIAGTLWGQRAVRGAHLTDRQGSTINLSAAGAALIGLGVVALTEVNSAAVLIGVPSGLALITHQILFNNFKTKNLSVNFRGSRYKKNNYHVSLKITPESYFQNKLMSARDYRPPSISRIQQPLFKLVFRF